MLMLALQALSQERMHLDKEHVAFIPFNNTKEWDKFCEKIVRDQGLFFFT